MLRRATALKRICDRQRVQNAKNAGFERGDIEKGVILSVLSSADTL